MVIAAVLTLLPRNNEPMYKGKSLSAWLTIYGYGNAKQQSEAVAAVQKIGTNAPPWLLKWRKQKTSSALPVWKRKILFAVDKLPLRLLWKVRLQRRITGPGDMYAETLWGF